MAGGTCGVSASARSAASVCQPANPEAQLQALQDKIRANPQNSEQWALLGEYYLWQNDYSNSLLAYRQALQLRGENAELYAALATVLYYRASQHMTVRARAMIDKALALDSNEITALMLLASDAFMQANYAQAIELWQKVMDLNSPRINRTHWSSRLIWRNCCSGDQINHLVMKIMLLSCIKIIE